MSRRGSQDTAGGVAECLSEEKARFVKSQLPQLFLGGARFPSHAPITAYIVQAILLIAPLIILLIMSFAYPLTHTKYCTIKNGIADKNDCTILGYSLKDQYPVALISGGAMAVFVIIVQLVRFVIVQKEKTGGKITPKGLNHTQWFVDEGEAADWSSGVFSTTGLQFLCPAPQSFLHFLLNVVFSFLLLGTASVALHPTFLQKTLTAEIISYEATVVLSIFGMMSVSIAQHSLTARAPHEISQYRHKEEFLHLNDLSRPFFTTIWLMFIWLELPGSFVFAVIVCCLPLLWFMGTVPQIDALLGYLLEQHEVYVCGGTPSPNDKSSIVRVIASSACGMIVGGVANQVREWIAHNLIAVFLAFLLVIFPTGMSLGKFRPVVHFMDVVVSVVGIGVGLAVRLTFDSKHHGAAHTVMYEHDPNFHIIRNVLEISAITCCGAFWVGKFVFNPSKCIAGRIKMASSRICTICALSYSLVYNGNWLWWGRGGANNTIPLLTSIQYILIEQLFYGVLLIRSFRFAWHRPVAACFCIALNGLIVFVIWEIQGSSDLSWIRQPLELRLMWIWVITDRALGFFNRLLTAMLIIEGPFKDKKLWHPKLNKILFSNVFFFPFVLLILILSAALQSPLICIFSLPIFLVGFPRHLRTVPNSSDSNVEKVSAESMAYEVLQPSLLESLKTVWKQGIITNIPGTFLLCRSHDRLVFVIQIIGSGLNWVGVELRGLEAQDPTSCHHIEANAVDQKFETSLKNKSKFTNITDTPGVHSPNWKFTPANSPTDHSQNFNENSNSNSPQELSPQDRSKLPNKMLKPICLVPGITYESSTFSLRGFMDTPKAVDLVHALFMRALVWKFKRLLIDGEGQTVEKNAKAILKRQKSFDQKIQRSPVDVNKLATFLDAFPTEWAEFLGCNDAGVQASASAKQKSVQNNAQNNVEKQQTPDEIIAALEQETSMDTTAQSSTPHEDKSHEQVVEKPKVDMKSAHDDLDDLLAMVMDDEPPSSKISKDNDQKFDSISPTKEPSPSPSPLKVPNVPLKEKKEKKSSASDRRPSFEDVGLGLSPKKRKEQEERLSEQRRKSEEKKAKEENYQISPYGPVTDAVLKAYSIINGTCLYWMSPASGGLSHIVKVFNAEILSQSSTEVTWMKEECVEFKEAVLGAFRVAVKVALDLQAVGESLEEQKNEELLSEFETAENEWHMGSENNDEWANAMKKRTKHFLSFNKSQSSINNEVSCVKMHLKEDQVRVGSLRGIWASQNIELKFMANDDDERYSLQAHSTLLRNLVVQAGEYPVYKSYEVVQW